MTYKWPTFFLKETIEHRKEYITINDSEKYKRCRVKVHAKGIELRDEIEGALIKTKRQQLCKTNDFLVAEIDAKVGGFGIVPHFLNGAIVSSHYFLYAINHNKLNVKYLNYFIRTPFFKDQVKAQGSTNYAAIIPHHVLNYVIPLPSLEIQNQLVKKIEFISEKINEVSRLRQGILDDAQAMLSSAFHQIIKGAEYQTMEKVAPIVRRKVEIEIDGEYPELGVRSFGKGTFHKPVLNGIDVGTKKLYHILPNDLVFSNVFAWEGAIAVVKKEDNSRTGSHRFITCVPKDKITTSNFLCFYFLTDEGIEKIREASPGGAGRNRTLGLKKLEQITVPIPSYDKQLWFNSLQAKVADIKKSQADNQTELDALLPAILDKAFKGELV